MSLEAIKTAVALTPAITTAVRGMDTSHPDLSGSAKKDLILAAISAACEVGEKTNSPVVQLASLMIDAIVTALRSNPAPKEDRPSVFRFSATEMPAETPVQGGWDQPGVKQNTIPNVASAMGTLPTIHDAPGSVSEVPPEGSGQPIGTFPTIHDANATASLHETQEAGIGTLTTTPHNPSGAD